MDFLDKHDLEALLQQYKPFDREYDRDRNIEAIVRFVSEEIPRRERVRRGSARPEARMLIPVTVRVHESMGGVDAVIEFINARLPKQTCQLEPMDPGQIIQADDIPERYRGDPHAGVDCATCGRPKWMHGTRHDTCATFKYPEATAGATGGGGAGRPKKSRSKPSRRWAGLIVGLTTLIGCAGPADDAIADDAMDADGGADADPDAPDAELGADGAAPDADPAGLPLGSACDPRLDQCAVDLACRVSSTDPIEGTCLAAGPAAAGDACAIENGDGDCGQAMACLPSGGGEHACYVICDREDPAPRCGADACVPAWGADVAIGACVP